MAGWTDVGAAAIGPGLGFLTHAIGNRSQNKINEWQRRQYEDALRRRNALQGLALPSMVRALGYSPEESYARAAQYTNGIGQPSPSAPSDTPQPGSSTLSKVGNAAGLGMTGLGIASKLGAFGGGGAPTIGGMTGSGAAAAANAAGGVTLGSGGLHAATGLAGHLGLGGGSGLLGMGAATIPVIGGALGAGLLAKHYIGQGRRAADKFVGSTENQFGQVLAQISQTAAQNPQAAKQQLQQAEAAYRQSAQEAIAKGGNEAKVAQQSLTNPKLWETVQRLKQQLGIS